MSSIEAQVEELTYYIISRDGASSRNVGEITIPAEDDAQNFADAIFAPMIVEAVLRYEDQMVEFSLYRTTLVEGKLQYMSLGKHIARRNTDIKAFAIKELDVPAEAIDEVGFTIKEYPDKDWLYALDMD